MRRVLTNLIRNLIRRDQRESELDEELRAFMDLAAGERQRRGLNESEARRLAALEMDGVEKVKEQVRDVRTGNLVEQGAQDLRHGIRMLSRSPGFAVTAILSLGLGIGGVSAMFSLVHAVLIRPLPYPEPERLVKPGGVYPKGAAAAMDELSRTMSVAAFTNLSAFNLTGEGEAVRLQGSAVSAKLFSLLGVKPGLGRVFAEDENLPGRERVAILSHRLWQSRFQGDASVIGKSILIDGEAREVVGVMAADFGFPSTASDLWVPLRMDPGDMRDQWSTAFIPVVARLRSGAGLAQAQAEIRPLTTAIISRFPYPMPPTWNAETAVTPLQEASSSDIGPKLLLLFSGMTVVLLIACSNVASLLVSRSLGRRKEMALRSSLGASRGRMVRQLLTESMVLALAGGVVGALLAGFAMNGLKGILAADSSQLAAATMDWRVLAFTAAISILTGSIFGVLPAIRLSRVDLSQTMRSNGQRSTGTAGIRLRNVLAAGEVALSVVLVSGAALLIASLWRLAQVNPGFRADRITTVRVSPDMAVCGKRSACAAFYEEILRRTREITGVEDAAAVNNVPLSGDTDAVPGEFEGHPVAPGERLAPMVWAGAVTPGYFRLMGIPVINGRELTAADGETSEKVVIVSESTARQFWPDQNPIGKHFRPVFEDQWRTVVGIAADVSQFDLAGRRGNWMRGAVYMPYPQSSSRDRTIPAGMSLLVKTHGSSGQVAEEVRRVVASMNPHVPVSGARALEDLVSESTTSSRTMAWLFGAFGGLALAMAVIGTYGVVSYTSAQRTYEIGVRLALGATRGGVFWMVLRQSLTLTAAGLTAGLGAAIGLSRTMSAYLFGVGPHDPATFAVVCGVILAIGLAAGFAPARKAASLSPIQTLRAE